MNNVFKDAYFGKPYKTRGGEIALFHTLVNERPQCLVQGVGLIMYTFNGVCFNAGLEEYYKSGEYPKTLDYKLNQFSDLDIISEKSEQINVEKLTDIAKKSNKFETGGYMWEGYNFGFTAGYYKALEDEKINYNLI